MLYVYPVAKLGVARRPPCPQKRNISPHRCLNQLLFLIFDSETADEPEKSHASLTKTSMTTGWNSKLSTLNDLCSQLTKQLGKMPLSPYLTTVTQLRVTKIT
jgi:hypothetical protein